MRRALISVYDKSGVVELARGLSDLGGRLVSTGGTARLLREAGLRVRTVSEMTGFPEILNGRVKTLHPIIEGGILARRDDPGQMQELGEHGIRPIDVVVVNLYPFRETVSRPAVTMEDALENIDIGGVTLLRAAAKNHPDVIVLVDPADYGPVLAQLSSRGEMSRRKRLELAAKAFAHTAAYDGAIAAYLEDCREEHRESEGHRLPERFFVSLERAVPLRYGENPHQGAGFYVEVGAPRAGLAASRQLSGKELSFNNLNDAAAAWGLVSEFEDPAAVAVKHANPCGCACAGSLPEAFRMAKDADPVSIFGGIVAFNRPVDAATAALLREIFLEVVLAPAYEPGVLDTLIGKRNLRVVEMSESGGLEAALGRTRAVSLAGLDLRSTAGGFLVQTPDASTVPPQDWRLVTSQAVPPPPPMIESLRFAWTVVRHVKSNAIVVASGSRTAGIGAGQMNRIESARIALAAAGEKARGGVLASDAFFPFPDVVEAAAKAGIAAIVQPGGSVKDEESIARAEALGVAMFFTGVRHFRH